jgi:hypothetical protein
MKCFELNPNLRECANCKKQQYELEKPLNACKCYQVDYCNKQCQKEHWKTGHRLQCSQHRHKRQVKVCDNCGARKGEEDGARLRKCGKCATTVYCSRACQVKHWYQEHRSTCPIWAAHMLAMDMVGIKRLSYSALRGFLKSTQEKAQAQAKATRS